MSDAEIYARIEPPRSIVVRFGRMKLVGEYAYDGDAKPGCGTKLVARTHRGTELVEMLTTTCENAGCSKSVTRQELLDYIENSGGQDFPFHTEGRILRIATIEDLNLQSAMEGDRTNCVRICRQLISELDLKMKLVEVEPILGGELLTFYYMSEERVDFRELVRCLAGEFKTRIEMRQVGARDEARLVADYERCGQYCCCKNFLKVLKPVSMKAAKMQKATLDPLKISGRCGRLMCCLRYEDKTYRELKERLPQRNARVGTSEGPGQVVDTKTLVQLVLVKLDHDDREIAVPVEELMDPDTCPPPGTVVEEPAIDVFRGMSPEDVQEKVSDGQTPPERRRKRRRRRGSRKPDDAAPSTEENADIPRVEDLGAPEAADAGSGGEGETSPGRKKRRRRGGRRRRRGGGGEGAAGKGG